MTGTVESLFVASEGSAPMERVESVEAVSGGLSGDRYQRGTGHYAPFDVCEVTLIEAEDVEAIREEAGIDLGGGQHRRNVVTRGVDLEGLLGATISVGDAQVRGTRRRPPCAHVERVAEEKGLARALRGRGGICADVGSPGEIRVGDPIEVVEADPRTAGRAIAERLRGRE